MPQEASMSDASTRANPDLVTLRRRLAEYEPKTVAQGNHRTSAVLVPIVMGSTGPKVILTVRPSHLSQHGGQVSFPGGSIEATDKDPWAAAVREAQEEIGLDPSLVTPMGRIDDYITITGYHVSPHVGLVAPNAHLEPCPDEVAAIFTPRLSTLAAPGNRRTFTFPLPSGRRHATFLLGAEEVVWGATAAMLLNLFSVIGLDGRDGHHDDKTPAM